MFDGNIVVKEKQILAFDNHFFLGLFSISHTEESEKRGYALQDKPR